MKKVTRKKNSPTLLPVQIYVHLPCTSLSRIFPLEEVLEKKKNRRKRGKKKLEKTRARRRGDNYTIEREREVGRR